MIVNIFNWLLVLLSQKASEHMVLNSKLRVVDMIVNYSCLWSFRPFLGLIIIDTRSRVVINFAR